MRTILTTLLVGGALTAAAAAQSGTLDQQSPFANVSFNGHLTNWDRAQNVQCGVDGVLEGIEFEVWGLPSESSTVNIWVPATNVQGPPGAPATLAGTFQVAGAGNGWVIVYVDMLSANISLNSGDFFVVEIIGDPNGVDYKGNAGFPAAMYPHEFWETAGSTTYGLGTGTTRLGLQTYMLPPPPPGPTLALTGSCPGPGTLGLSNFTPNGIAGLAWSFTTGSNTLTNGPCVGTTVDLLAPQVLSIVAVDGNGALNLPVNMPAQICGLVTVQGLDVGTCVPSNTVAP